MSLRIIDVSEHQGKIDWATAKKHIDGAIIRTGYGDDIKSQDDKYAAYNMAECERLGIPYATYLYSYANSSAHIKSEIAHEKRMTKGRKTLFHMLDLEVRAYTGTWKQAAQEWLKAFPGGGVYTWQGYFSSVLKNVAPCKRWVCRYGTNSGKPESKYKPSVTMDGWQYTSRGQVKGINGNVDVSEWYTDFGAASESVKPAPGRREVLKKEVAALIMRHLCTHNAHGYTQDMTDRQGTGTEVINVYGRKYAIKSGDRDCSSAVISAYEAAGISCGGATYTGNMKKCMTGTGNFAWRSMKFVAQMGDTYLNEKNHTAMCLSAEPDVLMEFSINEKGKATGGKVGDQKQQGEYDEALGRGESHLKTYYDYPWDGILQCINDDIAFYVEADGTITEPTAKISAEIPFSEKTDTDLAVEVLFGVHGSGDKRKKALGMRYDGTQSDVNRLLQSNTQLLTSIQAYLKKFGSDKLI